LSIDHIVQITADKERIQALLAGANESIITQKETVAQHVDTIAQLHKAITQQNIELQGLRAELESVRTMNIVFSHTCDGTFITLLAFSFDNPELLAPQTPLLRCRFNASNHSC
jgi:hypothetical protein